MDERLSAKAGKGALSAHISVMASEAPPYQRPGVLTFRPVQPMQDAARLIAYGRGLYIESLGDDRVFRRDYGVYGQRFPLWIAACAAANPSFAAFLSEDGVPRGFVAIGAREGVGHIHHLYVESKYRGRGFGGLLDDYARDSLKLAGCRRARLNVTVRNGRALRFYTAQGWRDIGPAGKGMRQMEVAL